MDGIKLSMISSGELLAFSFVAADEIRASMGWFDETTGS
jgi:hypothetical protein